MSRHHVQHRTPAARIFRHKLSLSSRRNGAKLTWLSYAGSLTFAGFRLQGRGLPEAEARRLLRQLLAALQFAHERGVVNRDVKVRRLPAIASCRHAN